MIRIHRCATLLLLALILGACNGKSRSVVVENNHPFEIAQPIVLSDGTVVDLTQRSEKVLVVQPVENGVSIQCNGNDLGRLSWGVTLRPSEPDVDKQPPSTKRDFEKLFKPLPLKFVKAGSTNSHTTYTASAESSGLSLQFELRAYRTGFVDLTTRYSNLSAPTSNVYAAIVTRWDQPGVGDRSAGYNYETVPLTGDAWTPFREGTERHLFVQRGVDWINSTFGNAGVVWLNDFTASFTTHREATAKKPAHWVGANTAQLAQEAQGAGEVLFSITEITRPNIPMYRSRLSDSVLPQPGEEPLTTRSRMIFFDSPVGNERVDELFVGYAGWRHEEKVDGRTKLTLGVPFTEFGTNYFPYSTLGENFIELRMPGMSKEGYWPLAAATVNEYEKFADIIKRDLRILKAMGFTRDRLHHLEVLWDKDSQGKEYVPQERRQAYLDFFFNQLKTLGLKALLDVKLPPETVAWLVERYEPLIAGVEVDNEVLIFQIYDHEVQYWKDVYAAVKKVSPDMPVHLTCHTNTGAFERLKQLGVPFDRIGAHAYMDSLTAIPSSRGYALAVGNYAAKQNMTAAITEWNWRFLTRMTEEARAKVYPPIFENVLKTRSISTMYQFQFNDGLAMNPAQLKGIRHYEPIHLSRRPKPEGMKLAELISEYSDPTGMVRRLQTGFATDHLVVRFRDENAHGAFSIRNAGETTMKLKPSIECFDGATARLDDSVPDDLTLKPGQRAQVPFTVTVPRKAVPGFYHVFLRLEDTKGNSRYAWAEARREGAVPINKAVKEGQEVVYRNDALEFDFNRPIAVVYGQDAPIPELEAAWVIYQTLEAASGREVEIYELNDLPEETRRNGALIAVGTPATNQIIAQLNATIESPTVTRQQGTDLSWDCLYVTGQDTEAMQTAAMDLVLRYWKYAKDSGIRRVGTTTASSGQGGVKTDID